MVMRVEVLKDANTVAVQFTASLVALSPRLPGGATSAWSAERPGVSTEQKKPQDMQAATKEVWLEERVSAAQDAPITPAAGMIEILRPHLSAIHPPIGDPRNPTALIPAAGRGSGHSIKIVLMEHLKPK